jgi:ankyrin repeat protein
MLMEDGFLTDKYKSMSKAVEGEEPQWLLLYGKLVDASLHATAFNNHPELTKKYILEGAFVNIKDHEKKTALHICALQGLTNRQKSSLNSRQT